MEDTNNADIVPVASDEKAITTTEAAPTEVVAPKKKRVVLALPGNSFSNNFLINWTRAMHVLWDSGRYEVVVSCQHSSFVPFARMKTMGLDVTRGKDQKAFNGLEYDVYVTIDSDVMFTPAQLIELIESTDIHPIVSGAYMMADLQHFACVKEWDESYFAQHGTFQFLTPADVEAWRKETNATFMPVSYNGMGFWAMRKAALDALQYPFFHQDLQRIITADGKELVDMCSEDVSFCKNLAAAGYQIMLHTGIRVGHEKPIII
jgi:hypothetical protein